MSRKTAPEPAQPSAPHPLPSEGGSYEIAAGELRQVAPPTAPDGAEPQVPNLSAANATPLTEA
jgi:hypothetical protein